ncbi:cytochrome-c peroxidase [Leptospira sp. GIMC2001]|uniref:cytochrome-c peroxidase n=1 Tax=Leptospira sp. GIMC2001 TaxID=1513297 RepID=UPI00234A0E0F|nr:c-type cytochrome [Leptospira sp. GIMC2001]WCL49994.1 c-type cytochrome [Leptospira sp. GIMC2001]
MDGNLAALSSEEKVGLQLFMDVGCTNCHNGNLLGGRNFGKVDSIYSYNPNDLGRFEFTGNESDKYFFKIPSLRNVVLTQPYFHDGSVQTIQEAVNRMNAYNLNRQLDRSEINTIISFLNALSDKAKVTR